MNIHIPAQRPAPAQAAAAAAPAPEAELGWGGVVRVVVARVSLTMVLSLLVWTLLPLLIGWTPRVILSGSMEPRIHSGDVVVTRTVDPADLTKGHVITTIDPDSPEKTRTHRVLERDSAGKIVTKGDANRDPDSTSVTNDAVLGLGVVRVAYIGLPAYWIAERNWLALAASTLFLGWAAANVGAGRKRDDHGPDDADDDPTPPSSTPRHSRSRRVAASVAVAAMTVAAAAGPADAAFRGVTSSPTSSWSAATTFVVSYAQTVLDDSPQFYWRLEETSGSSAADAKNGRTGQVAGAYTWGRAGALTSQSSDTALGIDGGHVHQPTSLSSNAAFSVETWIKTTRSSGGGLVSLISSSNPERSLYMGNDGKVRFGRNGTALVTSPAALNNGAWHHVVYTNASSGPNRAKLYVDGTRVAQASTGVTATATGNWRAGQAQWNTTWTGSPDQFFRGDMDELAVYGKALTAQEVSDHYAAR